MKHYGNITEIDGSRIEAVDIITFGSPCQDLSVAGKRNGLAGERSGLFLEAIRIIREMREKTHGEKPRYIVWENVPGAFSSNKGEDFRTVLEEIAKTKDGGVSIPRPSGKWQQSGEILGDGYSIAWRTYDAQYWGVPQRRKRIYLVADFGGTRAGQIQFESDRLCRNFAQGEREGQGAAGTSADHAGASSRGIGADIYNGELTGEISATLTTASGQGAANTGPSVIVLNDQGGAKMDITEGITGTLRAEMHGHTPIVTAFHLTQDPTSYEELSPCLSTGNTDHGQAVIGVLTPKHYEAYQHHGWRESDRAGTLTANQNDHVRGDTPVILEPKVYGLSSKESNAWRSSNPHSGCYEAEATRTLDTRGGDPTCAQGGNIVVAPRVYESHNQDSRYKELGDKSETVVAKYGTGGGNTPIVVEQKPYSIGNGQIHSLYLDEKARTLDTMHDPQAIIAPALGIDRAAFNQGRNALYGFSIEEEVEHTLVAKSPNAVAQPTPDQEYPYIARRLTPLECCRLQGYPDGWAKDLKTPNPTEDEITEWAAVFETHRLATSPKKKPRSRNQVKKWLQDPQTDSAEYKMWGNSLAIPNAYQVLAGIAEEDDTKQQETDIRYHEITENRQLTIWDFMQ